MNLFSFSSLIVFVSNLILTIFLLIQGRKQKVSYILSIFSLLATVWGLGAYKFSSTNLIEEALFWRKIANVAVIFSPVCYYYFICEYLELKNKKHKMLLFVSFLFSIFFVFSNFFLPPKFFVGGLRIVFSQFYYPDWFQYKSFLYLFFYGTFYLLLLGYAFLLLLTAYVKATPKLRNTLKYFILGSVFGWLGPTFMWLIEFRIDIYPYANFLIAIYPAIWAYAIIKHRLMDIKVAITRGAILLIVYGFIVGLPLLTILIAKDYLQNNFADKWFYPPLALYTLLALFAPYIYLTLQTKAEQKRIRQQIHLHQSLKAASKTTIEVQSIDKLAKIIPRYLIRLYSRLDNKISHITLFLKDKKKEEYNLRSSVGNQKLQSDILINSDSYLVKWFTKVREVLVENGVLRAKEVEVLVYEDIDFWMNKASILSVPYKGLNKVLLNLKKEMRGLKASVILPSVYQKELLGFLILGEKTPDPYSLNDIDTLLILSNDMTIALKSQEIIEDLTKTQAHLVQSEKLKVVGEIASCLAHEVKNPLTTLKTFSEYLPQKMQEKDEEFIEKYRRLVPPEIERINSIVQKLLDFSKPNLPNFQKTDLKALIKEVVEFLSEKFLKNKIKVIENYSKDSLMLKIDQHQIRQVLLNLILNAIDAMPEGGNISISSEMLDNAIKIEISDTGKGIPEDELKNIFDPFFTKGKENGTGLGLFVANQIMSLHNGLIKVKSKYGEGTSFVLKFALGDEGPKGTEKS
ncbi:MAG: ATP-binding protein [Candidatus Omnitrophota bacterium]